MSYAVNIPANQEGRAYHVVLSNSPAESVPHVQTPLYCWEQLDYYKTKYGGLNCHVVKVYLTTENQSELISSPESLKQAYQDICEMADSVDHKITGLFWKTGTSSPKAVLESQMNLMFVRDALGKSVIAPPTSSTEALARLLVIQRRVTELLRS